MREARGKVEDIPGFQNPFFGRLEFLEESDFEARAIFIGESWLFFDAPFPLPRDLHQKYVEVIDVRSYVPEFRCVADHDVIEAPVGQEREVIEDLMDFRNEAFDRVHEKRPVRLRKFRESFFSEGSLSNLPWSLAALFYNETGMRGGIAAETREFFGSRKGLEIREGLTDQEGLFLPVSLQEFIRDEVR